METQMRRKIAGVAHDEVRARQGGARWSGMKQGLAEVEEMVQLWFIQSYMVEWGHWGARQEMMCNVQCAYTGCKTSSNKVQQSVKM